MPEQIFCGDEVIGVIRGSKEPLEIEFEVPEKKSRNKHSQLRKELRVILKEDLGDKKPWEMALQGSVLNDFVSSYNKMWSKGPGRPPIKMLSQIFGISECTVQHLRKDLELPLLNSPDHPKIREIKKRIRRLYVGKEMGSEQIGRLLKCHGQTVLNYLRDMKVTLRPQHVTNCKYFRTNSNFSPPRLLLEIKKRYDMKMPLKQIAKEVGVWEGTVSSKIVAMGLDPPRKGRVEVNCAYGTCVWCGVKFRRYISNGPKKQIFCSHSHKNKAKDLRRSLTPKIIKGKIRCSYETHLKNLALEFKGQISRLNLPADVEERVRQIRGAPLNKIKPEIKKELEKQHRERANKLYHKLYGKKYYAKKKSLPKPKCPVPRMLTVKQKDNLDKRKNIILDNVHRTIASGKLFEKVKSEYNNYKTFQRDIKRFSKEGVIKTRLLKRRIGGYVTLISKRRD
jgi:hypothetical protein